MWRSRIKTFLMVLLMSGFIWVLAERQKTQSDEVEVRVLLPVVRNDKFYEYLDDNGVVMPDRAQTVRLQVEGPVGVIQKVKNPSVPIIEKEIPPLPKDTQQYAFGVVKEIFEGSLSVEDGGGVLNVQNAVPPTLTVREYTLVKRSVPVVVRSRPDGNVLSAEILLPATLEAMCLAVQPEEATVWLTQEQQRQALNQQLKVPAEIRIGNVTISEHPVEIKLVQAAAMKPVEIRPKLGVLRPARNWPFKLVIDSKEFERPDLTDPILVRGSTAAVKAYQDIPYHLLLTVRGDEEIGKTTTGPLGYYIPENLRSDLSIENTDKYRNRTINYRLEAVETPPASN
ncbi:MAG: hypothetical protein JW709_12655 [Sedimentisphaerales bacterium]|nr:hypothetical protein [Sedimentisphaerales bacterium]